MAKLHTCGESNSIICTNDIKYWKLAFQKIQIRNFSIFLRILSLIPLIDFHEYIRKIVAKVFCIDFYTKTKRLKMYRNSNEFLIAFKCKPGYYHYNSYSE